MSDSAISAAGLRIVKLLIGMPPRTVSDLLGAVDVTRTAVVEQLNELVAAGFVERSTEQPGGRGRPRHRYKATNAALALLYVDNQRLVVPAIWSAIREIGGEALTAEVLQRVSRAIADRYAGRITARRPATRLRQFIALLAAEGALIEAAEGDRGQLIFHRRSCPFISMVDEGRNVCRIDQEVFSMVVGRPVRRTACRSEGAPCCVFEIAEDAGGADATTR